MRWSVLHRSLTVSPCLTRMSRMFSGTRPFSMGKTKVSSAADADAAGCAWWSSARRNHRYRILRGALVLVLVGIFAIGFVPLVRELAFKGQAAFVQRPVN